LRIRRPADDCIGVIVVPKFSYDPGSQKSRVDIAG
jgi:hypothetical protein